MYQGPVPSCSVACIPETTTKTNDHHMQDRAELSPSCQKRPSIHGQGARHPEPHCTKPSTANLPSTSDPSTQASETKKATVTVQPHGGPASARCQPRQSTWLISSCVDLRDLRMVSSWARPAWMLCSSCVSSCCNRFSSDLARLRSSSWDFKSDS